MRKRATLSASLKSLAEPLVALAAAAAGHGEAAASTSGSAAADAREIARVRSSFNDHSCLKVSERGSIFWSCDCEVLLLRHLTLCGARENLSEGL